MLAAWLHNLDPYALRLWGDVGIRWYGLSYIAGFCAAWLLMRWLATRGLILIPPHRVGDALLTLVLGVIVGGRLGYVVFYEPSLLWQIRPEFPWWGVLMIHKGGLASHGGMIGVTLACWRLSRGWATPAGVVEGRCPPLHVMDAVALCAPIGLMLGRLANFINGELLGKVVAMPGESAPWWAVKFPQEVLSAPMTRGGHAPPLSPEQEIALRTLVEQFRLPQEGFEQGYQRVLARLQHGSADVAQRLEPLISARHPSQLYQALAEGVALGALLWWIWRRPRTPGVMTAWFLIAYGLLRVLTEFWRLPDAHLHVQRVLGLSRGQWLSVLMVTIGLVLLAAVRKNGQKLGGWALAREKMA